MKMYQKPLLEVLELIADEALAGVIEGEQSVVDNDDVLGDESLQAI